MRKLSTIAISATICALSIGAIAGLQTKSAISIEGFDSSGTIYTCAEMTTPYAGETGPNNAPSVESIGGYKLCTDTLTSGAWRTRSVELAVKDASKGEVVIKQIYGNPTTCNATVNGSDITIQPQLLYRVMVSDTESAPVWICPIDTAKNIFSYTDPVRGQVTENGTIKLQPWGLFVIEEGPHKNLCVLAVKGSAFRPCNATIEAVNFSTKATDVWGVILKQPYQNLVEVENFGNSGETVGLQLSSDRKVVMPSQYLGTNSLGQVFTYSIDATKPNPTAIPTAVEGTMNANGQLQLGAWGAFPFNSPAKPVDRYTSTLIKGDYTLEIPSPVTTSFEGSGTEASPYIIKTYTDLLALSSLVNADNDFAGKHFRMDADIDCAGQRLYFSTIGSSTSNLDYFQPFTFNLHDFNGTFDGAGHTIRNLKFHEGMHWYIGLFGVIGKQGVVKNITLENFDFESYGRLCGFLAGLNLGTIDNCHVKSSKFWAAMFTIGGIAGENFGTIRGSSAEVDMQSRGTMGGICGYNAGLVEDCTASGHLTIYGVFSTNDPYIGGIVGTSDASSSRLTDESDVRLNRCRYWGMLSDTAGDETTCIGGVSGAVKGTQKRVSVLENSLSLATIHTVATGRNGLYAGLVGTVSNPSVRHCAFAGQIKADAAPAMTGGLVAQLGAWVSDGAFNDICITGRIASVDNNPSPLISLYPQLDSQVKMGRFSNVVYDRQMTGLTITDFNYQGALTTSQLTGSTLPSGLSSEHWSAVPGRYPIIKGMESDPAWQVASAPVFLTEPQSTRGVKGSFRLADNDVLKWGVLVDGKPALSNDAITIKGNNVELADMYATESLVCYSASNPELSKEFVLTVVPDGLFEGAGTEASPYLIKTYNDLKTLADEVNDNGNTFEGAYFRQTADIVCEPDFKGIATDGVATHVFAGIYDGDGHSIDNFRVDAVKYDTDGKAVQSGSMQYVALFGRANATAIIRNLTLGAGSSVKAWAYVGGIVGILDGKIENCVNLAEVSSIANMCGGVVGNLTKNGSAVNCYNAGKINGGGMTTGGIVGNCYALVKGCQNDGTVTGAPTNSFCKELAQSNVGGVAGNVNSTGIIESCLNTGTISGAASVGGIAGALSNATVNGCVSTGVAIALKEGGSFGGLVGNKGTGTPKMANNYYDDVMNPYGAANMSSITGCRGIASSALVAGTTPEGLDKETFDFSAGILPVLKTFADNATAKTNRHMTLLLPGSEVRTDFAGTALVGMAEGMTVSLSDNSPHFTLSGSSLTAKRPADSETASVSLLFKTSIERPIPLRSVANVFSGEGTPEAPFILSKPEDLTMLSRMTNTYQVTYNGKYFTVTNDIDCSSLTDFMPIGYNYNSFGGIIAGNSHAINKLDIAGHTEHTAFVGNLGVTGEIHNLTLAEGKVSTEGAQRATAGFAAVCQGLIENCVNRDTISTEIKGTYAGGIAYQVKDGGILRNCNNYGYIVTRSSYLGGIAADAQPGSLIDGCENHGTLNPGGTQSGAIVGTAYSEIRNCRNHADIVVVKGSFGGIAGYARDTTRISHCENLGKLTLDKGAANVGGIVGYVFGRTYLDSCVNKADIHSTGGYAGGIIGRMAGTASVISASQNFGKISSDKQYVGGLAGYVDGNKSKGYNSFENLSNYGAVEATGNYVAGAFGYIKAYNTVRRCVNYADVKGLNGNFTSGFAAYGYAEFSDCLNTGNVAGNGYATAGFVSDASGAVFNGCVNTGSVKSTAAKATLSNFGAAGFMAKGSAIINSCVNMGSVSAPDFVAGFAGNVTAKASISDSFTSASVEPGDSASCVQPFVAQVKDAEFNRCLFNIDEIPAAISDTVTNVYAKPITTDSLLTVNLGDGFAYMRACFPMVKALADEQLYAIRSIGMIVPDGSGTSDAIRGIFYIGWPCDGLQWQYSGGLLPSDTDLGMIYPSELGKGWVKVSTADGRISRTFNLNVVNTPTNVDTVETDADIVEEMWFTPQGFLVPKPSKGDGMYYLVRRTYTDGTSRSFKILNR